MCPGVITVTLGRMQAAAPPLVFYHLHHWGIRLQNWGFYFLDLPGGLGRSSCIMGCRTKRFYFFGSSWKSGLLATTCCFRGGSRRSCRDLFGQEMQQPIL